MINSLFGDRGEPDFINEVGTKWWRIPIDWGKHRNLSKNCEKLKVSFWYTETSDDDRNYIDSHLENIL